ncbi:MAG: hypothetical protein GXP62_02090 [Oligoflexia bacterium]|nr:hypothetical protein [Oligoflexia bacterium]
MSEDTATSQLHESGAAILGSIFSLVRALRLYAPNNAAVIRILDELESNLTSWFEQGDTELSLKVMTGEAFVNGRLLKTDVGLYEKITSLHERLSLLGVNEFTFLHGIDRATLESLAADLVEAMTNNENKLALRDTGTLRLGLAKGDAIASYRFEPDRLAVWLYGSLLDLADTLYQQVLTGPPPSLLPLRRTLQLVIDNMRSHAAIYQLLAAISDPDQVPSPATRHVRVAIDMVGFGLFLNLPVRDLMTMGLAGVLGGIATGQDTDAAIRSLLGMPGLGEAAMPLTLLLHDAVAARAHRESGMPGRTLAMIETYIAQTSASAQHPAHAPHGVLKVMAAGKVGWLPSELAHAFFAYKGVFPLGSLVQIDGQDLAIVVARRAGVAERSRPTVLEIRPGETEQGAQGERIDLIEHPELKITGTPALATIGLRISDLVSAT